MDGVQMTGTANVAVRTSQTVLPRFIAQITDQIDFAPTAPGKKLILRSWERQPSTPFLARHKSRKIWKRFRKSMEAIRSRTAPSAPSRIEESDFVNEISQSANAPYLRAVKRQRVLHTQTERGASFLETKWELEIGRRMRKLVGRAEDEQLVANSQEDENEADGDNLAQSLDESSQSAGLTTAADAAENNTSSEDDEDTDRSAVISEIVDLAVDAQGGQVAAEVRELIAKQGPSLVRSALRMNSLDGEDVALLSEFLSRAQAKRAANAAMASGEESDIRQKKVEEVSSPAVQSRRALEELDVNSPSIQKPAISTPVKAEKLPESPDAPEPTADDTSHLTSSPTVACRRSTRTKPSTTQQTRSLRPAVPNQIPVRRANGTEFVFLQRTEAQELALKTRKNTRRNKGNALLPRFLLQAILKQERNDETTQPMTRIEEKNEPCQSPGKRSSRPKQVCWNEDKLVEYAPERISPMSVESPSPAKKKSSTSRREGDKTSSMTTTPALPATPSKKVRRINMAASSSVDDSSARAIKPVGTPIPKRKKLTPRLKSTAESSSDHSSKDALLSATKLAKHIPSTSQQTLQKMSGIPRSKTLIKPPSAATSSAGVTPVVKRVRHRRAAV